MLSKQQLQQFFQQSQHLKPIVIIGSNGLTAAVQQEIDRALIDHELIKIRVNAADKQARQEMIDNIIKTQAAELIRTVGHVAVIYRANEE